MLLLWLGCSVPTAAECDAALDADQDGLDECLEQDLGTDPTLADSDGDGWSDAEENDCSSDPLDEASSCYACGWRRGDPGTLSSDGADYGDTIANITLYDQCGDEVPLWDFAGDWHIVFATAAWCTSCLGEAAELDELGQAFADETGIGFSYITLLFQGPTGDPAQPEDAPGYAEYVGNPTNPVVADPDRAILDATPYDGSTLPGKCLLSPQMEILDCWTGHYNDDEALDLIRIEEGL